MEIVTPAYSSPVQVYQFLHRHRSVREEIFSCTKLARITASKKVYIHHELFNAPFIILPHYTDSHFVALIERRLFDLNDVL